MQSKGENALEEAGSTVETSSNALRKGVSKDMKGKVECLRMTALSAPAVFSYTSDTPFLALYFCKLLRENRTLKLCLSLYFQEK